MEERHNNKISDSKELAERLIELERKGIEASNNENYHLAVDYFKALLKANPDFEYGMTHYNLAYALDEIGNIDEAEKAYLKAIEYAPEDYVRLAGYASLVSRYRSPSEGFQSYLKLFKMALDEKNPCSMEGCLYSLYSLGEKMGLSKQEIYKKIGK